MAQIYANSIPQPGAKEDTRLCSETKRHYITKAGGKHPETKQITEKKKREKKLKKKNVSLLLKIMTVLLSWQTFAENMLGNQTSSLSHIQSELLTALVQPCCPTLLREMIFKLLCDRKMDHSVGVDRAATGTQRVR